MATLFIPNAKTGEMSQVIDLGGGARCPTHSTQPGLDCEKDMSKHTHYVNTEIPKDKAGMFIGKGGVLIKSNILGPATLQTKDDTIKFKVTTQDKDDGKIKIMCVATCPGKDSTAASRAASILKKYVEAHVEATVKKLQTQQGTAGSQQASVFIMKVALHKESINNFIGKRGQNISKIVVELERASSNLFLGPDGRNAISVNITPDRFVQRGGCFFKIMEGCSEAKEHAIITIRAFTKNRRETWEGIHPVIMDEVKRLNLLSVSTNDNDRYLSTSFTTSPTSAADTRTAFIDVFNALHSSPSASVADKRAADFITSFNARPPTERGAQIPYDYSLTLEPAKEIDLSDPPESPGYCPQDEAISPWSQ